MELAEPENSDGEEGGNGLGTEMRHVASSTKKKRIIWLASEGWDRNNEQVQMGEGEVMLRF